MNPNIEEFFKTWLVGTTCFRHKRSIHWISDDERFVILKHFGHNEWMGGWSGQGYCSTYYALYDVEHESRYGYGFIMKWDGQWKASYIDEALISIEKYKEENGGS